MYDLTDRLIEGSLRAADDAAICAENALHPILATFYRAKFAEHKRWAAAYAEQMLPAMLTTDSEAVITKRAFRALTIAAIRRAPYLVVSGEEAIEMAQRAFASTCWLCDGNHPASEHPIPAPTGGVA